jgi:multiple sugar transport system ATP-binding protein
MTMADRIAVLHDGKLQQLGTPEELFDTPANVFVAAFIGNPPINLVAGRLETGEGGRTVLCVGNQTVPLPPAVDSPSTPRSSNKRDVLVGIRPHDVQIEPVSGQPTALRVDVDLDLVERLGTETIAHGDVAGVTAGPALGSAALAAVLVRADQEIGAHAQGTRFAAALGSHVTVTPGTQLSLHVPVERLHLFDAETGVAIQTHERRAAAQAAPSEAHAG